MRADLLSGVLTAVFCGAILASTANADEFSVHGRVMGQTAQGDHLGPVAGAKVELLVAGGAVAGEATADAAGYYRIAGLGTSQHAYRVTAAGFREENAQRRIEVTVDGEHVFDIVLTKGTEEPKPAEEVEADGNLSVRTFVEKDGKREPLPQADVYLRAVDGGPMLKRNSGPQGRRIHALPPGTWRISAAAPGGEPMVHPEPVKLTDAANRQVVTLVVPAAPPGPPRAELPAPPANDGNQAAFYGDIAPARRVVFVVDKSNSMQIGKFEAALKELMRSVNYLTEQQQFYVIFFSDTLHPMLEPNAPAEMVPASTDARTRLERFASELPFRLGTNAHQAMDNALAMKPDVIYLLGDGAFTDDTASYLIGMKDNRVPICTVAFKSGERGATAMKRIAEANGGRFIYVP